MGEHKHKSKESRSKSKREHKKHKKESSKEADQPDIDYSDPSLWVEKTADEPASPPSQPPRNEPSQTDTNGRQDWMLDESFDFSSLGTSRKKEPVLKPDPDQIKISKRELNPHLTSGLPVDQYPEEKRSTIKFGDAGSNWRMMKLKRVMEQAKDEGRSVEEVGLERYGSTERLQEALDEQAYLDRRKSSRDDERQGHHKGSSRFMFSDSSSRSFKRPDAHRGVDEFGRDAKRRQTTSSSTSSEQRDEDERAASHRLAKAASQPVHTPVIVTQHELPRAFASDEPVLSRDELNKLNAKLVKAKIMGAGNVEELEKEYETQLQRFEAAEQGALVTPDGAKTTTVLPTVDSEGRLYDYAVSSNDTRHLNRKKQYAETHDKKTGERLKYGSSDDAMTLLEMFRQEKAGSRLAGDMDREFANRIASDATFENNLDYLDEKSDIMGSRKGYSEEKKMRHAIKDFKRSQATLEACRYCYHDGASPQCAMISLGTRTYLALPNAKEMVPGQCAIVPLEHVASLLECDDDTWDEIRNFQKCLLRMFHEQNCGVVFMETVTNPRKNRHTMMEAYPIPYGVYEEARAYFKHAIMNSDEEWSQHTKLIDTHERSFRSSMVKNLPYFHVWLGLDGGYGHVIENNKEFPYYFGKEIIAGMLNISHDKWRKPKWYDPSTNRERQLAFLKHWEQWDWTATLPA